MKALGWFLVGVMLALIGFGIAYGADYTDQSDGTAVIVLTSQDVKDCEEGGGCMLMTNNRHAKDLRAVAILINMAKRCNQDKEL